MPRPKTAEEAWAIVEKRLGRFIDPLIRQELERRGFVQDVLEAEDWEDYRDALNCLIDECRHLERFAQRVREAQEVAVPRRRQAEPRDDLTPAYAARLLALEAERRQDVQDFRSRHVDGALLPLEAVEVRLESWAAEGRSTGEMLWVPTLREGEPAEDFEWVWEFAPEDAPIYQERRLPVTEGPLEELKALAARLVATYPWTEAAAVALVMAGCPPGLVAARARYVGGAHPVVLELMPWLRAQEVAEIFSVYRQDYPMLFPRLRMLTKKMLEIALFRAVNPRIPWRQLVKMWNGRYPHWAYVTGQGSPDHRTFARDAKAAMGRLRERARGLPRRETPPLGR